MVDAAIFFNGAVLSTKIGGNFKNLGQFKPISIK